MERRRDHRDRQRPRQAVGVTGGRGSSWSETRRARSVARRVHASRMMPACSTAVRNGWACEAPGDCRSKGVHCDGWESDSVTCQRLTWRGGFANVISTWGWVVQGPAIARTANEAPGVAGRRFPALKRALAADGAHARRAEAPRRQDRSVRRKRARDRTHGRVPDRQGSRSEGATYL